MILHHPVSDDDAVDLGPGDLDRNPNPPVSLVVIEGASKTKYGEAFVFVPAKEGPDGLSEAVVVARMGRISKNGERQAPGGWLTSVSKFEGPSNSVSLVLDLAKPLLGLPRATKWDAHVSSAAHYSTFPAQLHDLPPDHPAVELWRASYTFHHPYWICNHPLCDRPGTREVRGPSSSRRLARHPVGAYTECDLHRRDYLHPEMPVVICDMLGDNALHLVRCQQDGSSPGDTLCGMPRFDDPNKAWSLHPYDPSADRQSQRDPSKNKQMCQACLDGRQELLKTPEYLESRVKFLERECDEYESNSIASSTARDEITERLDTANADLSAKTARLARVERDLEETNTHLNLERARLRELSALVTTTLADLEDRLSEREEDFVWGLIDGLTYTLHKHNKTIIEEIKAVRATSVAPSFKTQDTAPKVSNVPGLAGLLDDQRATPATRIAIDEQRATLATRVAVAKPLLGQLVRITAYAHGDHAGQIGQLVQIDDRNPGQTFKVRDGYSTYWAYDVEPAPCL